MQRSSWLGDASEARKRTSLSRCCGERERPGERRSVIRATARCADARGTSGLAGAPASVLEGKH